MVTQHHVYHQAHASGEEHLNHENILPQKKDLGELGDEQEGTPSCFVHVTQQILILKKKKDRKGQMEKQF